MSARRLTVVQTLPALDSGGVERGTLEIARALVEAGHRSIVVSRGGRLVERLEAEGSEHVALPVDRKSPMALLQVRRFRRLVAALAPDVVHARSRLPAWIAWFALRGMPTAARPAFVTSVHGLYSVSAWSAIMTRGDLVEVVSETARRYVLDSYPACPPERLRVIYRGVDEAEFPWDYRPDADWLARWESECPQLGGRRVLTLPGRISRLKGHEAFIRLIGRLRGAGTPVHGLIVGGAERGKERYLAELRSRVREAGLVADISFTGLRGDIREIFSRSDLVLSLSEKPESFGRTALEALALGVPVVGWARGGVGEILAELFPAGEVAPGDEEALCARVRSLLAEPQRPVRRDGRFSRAAMCAQTLELYREVAG